jgi:hypothetical protein
MSVPNVDISRTINMLQNRKPWEHVAPLMSLDMHAMQEAVQKLQGKVFGDPPPTATPTAPAPVVTAAPTTTVNGITGQVQIVGSGVAALPGTSNIVIQPNAGGVLVNSPVAISNIVETSGSVVTLATAASPFMQVGASAYLAGLSVGTWLNGLTITITSVSGSGIVFTDPTAHGAQASSAETGTAYAANVGAITAHSGKLLPFTGSPAATYALANPALKNGWYTAIQAVGAGGVTISPNGLLLDTSASSLVLTQLQGCLVYADGSAYWTMRGIS